MTSHKSSTKGRQTSSICVHCRFRILGMKHFFIFYDIHLSQYHWRMVLNLYSFYSSRSKLSERLNGSFNSMISKMVESSLKSRTLDLILCLSSGLSLLWHLTISLQQSLGTQWVKGWLWWVAVQKVRAEGKVHCKMELCPGCGPWG